MSVCYCDFESECLCSVRGPHIARTMPRNKDHHLCPNCGGMVKIGQRCVDARFIWPEWQTGSFARMHEECYELMELFGDEFCGGGWKLPFDLIEAAEHAAANAHKQFWRDWLELYEKTWEFSPEPPDPDKKSGRQPWTQ